jgi:hypothetical protein
MLSTNQKKRRSSAIAFFPVVIAMSLFASCHKENNQAKTPDPDSPASNISESEKLVVPDAVALPANLPNGNTRVATFYAKGVQKYKAQLIAGTDPARYEWVFVAPQADLFDMSNNKVGTHSAGPDWQLSATDSVFGQQFTPQRTAASTDPNSIDWLLLMPKTGKPPTGLFANVAYVQRLATKGGKAPAQAPVSGTDVVDVNYTAIYRFSKKN